MFDSQFKVEIISSTPNPNQLCYVALHTDYSENFVLDEKVPSEEKCGEILIDRCVKFNHWGILEHPQISFLAGGFPHSVMQQARTHRVGISFDCQSFRYSGKRISNVVGKPLEEVEKVFYLRPIGHYTDRNGAKYFYSHYDRQGDLIYCQKAAERYKQKVENGYSEEHARGQIPFDTRQNFVVSFNARSLLHFCDLRAKADAQLEIQVLSEMLFYKFKKWMPEVATHYEKTRLHKGRLAP